MRLRQGLLFDSAERPSQGPGRILRSDRESLTRRGAAEPESVSPDPSSAASEERPWRVLGLDFGAATSSWTARPAGRAGRSRGRPPVFTTVNWAVQRVRLGSPWPRRRWSCPADFGGCGGGG
ncbi:hypothetical protein NDU88_003321 [Pleurodeles waltl]|uniref:Uncharacterized protein n=1 Tax=Pleurodeles waltl TaxID=8319 RepID=A0AAV7UDQ1_PLEWA|nr:hypothetical protein NDU88_003321 [Pleurodeles waltl]